MCVYLEYVPSLSSRSKRIKLPLKCIKNGRIFNFFSPAVPTGEQASRRSISINFPKNLCKKVNLFGTHPVRNFLLKFILYPPVRNSWIRACRHPKIFLPLHCSNIKEVTGLEVGDIPWQDKRLFFLLGKVRCQNCKFSRPCHLPPTKILRQNPLLGGVASFFC